MKRKIIEVGEQENIVVCDNELCDYKVENPTKDPYYQIDTYLNVPCPKCGENLLTQTDLNNYKNLLKTIDFVNKWFGWLSIFLPKRDIRKVYVNTHGGIKVVDENNNIL